MTTPTTAREFAERLLDGCTLAYDGTLPFIRRRLDEAAALIEADRLATTQAAIRECVAIVKQCPDKSKALDRLRALTTQAPGEKARET
jgi:hypothetical protein